MNTHISCGSRYVLDADAVGDPPDVPELPACGARGEPVEVTTADVAFALESSGSADACVRALGALRHSVTCPRCRGVIARVIADMVWVRSGDNEVREDEI